ncbi:MAG: flagellar protein FlgN [Deltaproteobacteria bacterium]|nr:flagellar protein FlgN [Deltaproteobacteria bacterium]MBZ0219254.1 flagellar protein FlgN [Deltaproteobacteria bacterium]
MNGLIGHLKKEIGLCKELIAVLHRETESIVARDYKALYEAAGEKEGLVRKVNATAGARTRHIEEACASLGIPADNGTALDGIVERGGERGAELGECLKTLAALAASIKELNDLNSLAIRSSLDNIKKTLGFLGNFLQPSAYKPGGKAEDFAFKGSRLSKGA